MSPWLVIDVSYLAYKNFYTKGLGGLSYEEDPTGVVYGIFRDVLGLQKTFSTNRVAWCFDRGKPKRASMYSPYKSGRNGSDTDDLKAAKKQLRKQIRTLYNELLPEIGFRNLFSQEGYEADDLIASICLESLSKGQEAIIVSSDQDLYQLLGKFVSIWNLPKRKMLTERWFNEQWGLSPVQWADVKAIAGCSTDNIAGIKGIGEKTAAKHIRGDLKPSSKAFDAIIKGVAIWTRNLPLVRLPLEGTKACKLKEDQVKRKNWQAVGRKLGITSLNY